MTDYSKLEDGDLNRAVERQIFNQECCPENTAHMMSGCDGIHCQTTGLPVSRRFASDISAAMLVEDRIAELDLNGVYVHELMNLVISRADWTTFDLIHATPRQRSEAALQAIESQSVNK